MNTYNDYWVNNYLQHYGVPGMRWKKGRGVYNSKKINKLNKRTAGLKSSKPSSRKNQKLMREASYKKELKTMGKRESAAIDMEKAPSKNTRTNGKKLSNMELLNQAIRQQDELTRLNIMLSDMEVQNQAIRQHDEMTRLHIMLSNL